MDDETRHFLITTLQFLERQQGTLDQVMLVTAALRATVRELGPEAAKAYEKNLAAERSGPLGNTHADASVRDALSQAIRSLTRAN